MPNAHIDLYGLKTRFGQAAAYNPIEAARLSHAKKRAKRGFRRSRNFLITCDQYVKIMKSQKNARIVIITFNMESKK